MKNLPKIILPLFAIILSLEAASSSARAQLIASFNGDTLSLGSVTTWNDLVVGGQDAATVNFYDDPTAANSNSAVFNGHTYVDFGTNTGLSTLSALFSGGASRSVAAVYDTPVGDNGGVNPIAGQGGASIPSTWFMLQSRTEYATGSPYLAGQSDDVSSGSAPVANQLTFSLATYDGTTETLYWAYGLTGVVQSASFTASPALDTNATPFTIGYDPAEESLGDMQIGQVLVYENSLSGAQATSEIESLQAYYANPVPEPLTYALMGLAGLTLLFVRRRLKA